MNDFFVGNIPGNCNNRVGRVVLLVHVFPDIFLLDIGHRLQSAADVAAQRVFGPQAGVYAVSPVHVADPSLVALEAMASQCPTGGYDWALDLGTGAGFTAFAMAGLSLQVMAIDPTLAMLQQARRIGLERKLANLAVVRSLAEALPVVQIIFMVFLLVMRTHLKALSFCLGSTGMNICQVM